jgi:hypothetical protein
MGELSFFTDDSLIMVPLQKRLLLLVSPYGGFPKMMRLPNSWMLDFMENPSYSHGT